MMEKTALGLLAAFLSLGSCGQAAEPAHGGKLLAIGDSITAAGIWQRRVGELLGMDVRSHCKGGIGAIAMVDGDGDCVLRWGGWI